MTAASTPAHRRKRLPAPDLSCFRDAFDPARYERVDDNVWIAVTDVVASTDAIAQGHYKRVNLAGAAGIAALANAAPDHDLPFAFGGDGAVVLVPPELETTARTALGALQNAATRALGLELRTALVPVAAVRAQGRDVLLSYQRLAGERRLAMLAGGGAMAAEAIAKSRDGQDFNVNAAKDGQEPDLTGLSCRWLPIKPARGVMLSLLVEADGPLSDYGAIYDGVERASGGMAAPVSKRTLRGAWPPSALREEVALGGSQKRLRRTAGVLLEAGLGMLSAWSGLTIGGFSGRRYKESLERHSDYCKFADSLRMVIDCTPAEAAAVTSYLTAEQTKGRLRFGAHEAKAALMTCFVPSTEEGEHIHFIDGAEGGYALAAQGLKRRSRPG